MTFCVWRKSKKPISLLITPNNHWPRSMQLLWRTRLLCLYEEHRFWYKCPLSAFPPGNNKIVIAVYFYHLCVGKVMTSAGGSGRKKKNPIPPGQGNLKKESSGRGGTFKGAILLEEKSAQKTNIEYILKVEIYQFAFVATMSVNHRQKIGTEQQVTGCLLLVPSNCDHGIREHRFLTKI